MREGVRGGRGDDEREARDFGGGGVGATTTIFRSGSNGSLQQQALQQNGGVAVSIQYSPAQMRKTQKMILQGSRDKEKFLPWICKVMGRRSVGMLLLAVVSIVVFLSILSAFSKEDVSETPETDWRPLHPFVDIQNPFVILPSPSLVPIKHEDNANMTFKSGTQSPSAEHVLQDHPEVTNQTLFSSRRYCEHFAIPAPPVDRKRTGPRPCDVCYVPVEHAVALMPASPSVSPTLQNLNYFSEGNSYMNDSNEGSDFGGHPSLQQRNDSYDIKESMSIHCGFFKGSKPGVGSGFDIEEADLLEMEQCHGVVVASAIFGNYDVLQQPRNISEHAKKNACFYMFVDEETEAYMQNTTTLDSTNKAGIWRIVVVRNLPYLDARRNGKVPKLLLHRLFPKARYSLWVDGKLQLVVDPFQILERFLWRENATFAISRHYRRFDVFVEAEANKAAGKYDNASIDRQIEFYKNEGLTHYSEAKLPITSDVPEGCVIVKEHIPITNLFTCLWFNEVDRFTSRDQISFSTVRDKIMSRVNWSISMFLDCERRNFVIQAYHKDLLEQMKLEQLKRSLEPPPPPPLQLLPPSNLNKKPLPEFIPERFEKTPPRKPTSRRERRSSSRHRRPRVGKDINAI